MFKITHFKNLVIFFKSHHVVTKLDTLLGGTGHIYNNLTAVYIIPQGNSLSYELK